MAALIQAQFRALETVHTLLRNPNQNRLPQIPYAVIDAMHMALLGYEGYNNDPALKITIAVDARDYQAVFDVIRLEVDRNRTR